MLTCAELRKCLRHFTSLLLAVVFSAGFACRANAAWFDTTFHYRVPVSVPAGASVNSTIKVDVDFAALLAAMGVSGTFDVNSPRIVRPNDTLATNQEFTDSIYLGATDATGNSRGEIRFILQDAGPAAYYLYFDVVANGPKAVNPQVPINGNLEKGGAGTATPPGWTASTRSNANMDTQIRPSETISVTDATTASTDGTPNTGQFSYLIGYRTNADAVSNATLTKDFTVPASSPGNINIRIKPEGWDSAVNGDVTQYDFIRVRLINPATSAVLLNIAGPQLNNYATCPFSPNYRNSAITATQPGYGLYNYWDNGSNSNNHTLGMSAAYNRGLQPWTNCSVSLSAVAGQSVRLEIRTDIFNQYRTWFLIDDLEWSVVTAMLGTPETSVVVPGGFNAYKTATTLAAAITGVLITQLAGQSFSFDIVALNTAKNAIEPSFSGDVKVELLDSSNNSGAMDANGCRPTWTVIQTLPNQTFAASDAAVTGTTGRHRVTGVVEANVRRDVRVRITYPASGTPTAIGCSIDNFVIRPAAFVLSTTTALNPATDKLAAGEDFSLTATPYNAAATPVAITTGYTGQPGVDLTKVLDQFSASVGTALTWNNPTLPLPGSPAANGFPQSSGGAVSNLFQYQDVGIISFTNDAVIDSAFTAADQATGDCVAGSTSNTLTGGLYGCNVGSSALGPMGRFYPHHFAVDGSFSPACTVGGFTYMDSDALGVTLTVKAQSKANATTTRYVSPASTYVPVATLGLQLLNGSSSTDLLSRLSQPVVPTRAWTAGEYAASNTYRFDARNLATPVVDGPYDSLKFRVTITDTTDAVKIATLNGTALSPSVSTVDSTATKVRFGRVWLGNAYGSEKRNLTMPYEVQYWNGSAFVKNTVDSCTALTAANFGLGNYQGNVTSTNLSSTAITLDTYSAGAGSVTLTAPNAVGSADVVARLSATENKCPAWVASYASGTPLTATYLRGKWCGSSYDKDAVGRATFGIFGSSAKKGPIYLRENY